MVEYMDNICFIFITIQFFMYVSYFFYFNDIYVVIFIVFSDINILCMC